MAHHTTRKGVIEWPFKTVLPDGSVPPPSKIERINTFLENQIVQDGRARRSTHGMGRDATFLRQGVALKPLTSSEVTKVRTNAKNRPQIVTTEKEGIKGGERYVSNMSKAATSKAGQKTNKPSLPSITPKPVRKPLLMASSRCTVLPKQHPRISPDVNHCYLKSGSLTEVDHVRKTVPKTKLYTGGSRKHKRNKKIETSNSDKTDKRERNATFQLDLSTSGPKPSPQDCLRSFRQVRNGRKRYDSFWSPATALTSHTAEAQLVVTGAPALEDSESPRSHYTDQESRSCVSSSRSDKRSNMSSRNSTKHEKSPTNCDVNPPVTKSNPKCYLSQTNYPISDGDSDYNEQDLGNLDIVSSASETESTSGDPTLRVTGPELRSSIRKTVRFNTDDVSEDFKKAIEEYVTQIIQQAHGIYQKSIQENGNT